MVGQPHVERAEPPGEGAGQGDVGRTGQGDSNAGPSLVKRQPLPVQRQQLADDGAPVIRQRHAVARSPGGVKDDEVQSGHAGNVTRAGFATPAQAAPFWLNNRLV